MKNDTLMKLTAENKGLKHTHKLHNHPLTQKLLVGMCQSTTDKATCCVCLHCFCHIPHLTGCTNARLTLLMHYKRIWVDAH